MAHSSSDLGDQTSSPPPLPFVVNACGKSSSHCLCFQHVAVTAASRIWLMTYSLKIRKAEHQQLQLLFSVTSQIRHISRLPFGGKGRLDELPLKRDRRNFTVLFLLEEVPARALRICNRSATQPSTSLDILVYSGLGQTSLLQVAIGLAWMVIRFILISWSGLSPPPVQFVTLPRGRRGLEEG